MFAETKGDKGPLRIVGPSPVEALLTSETKKGPQNFTYRQTIDSGGKK